MSASTLASARRTSETSCTCTCATSVTEKAHLRTDGKPALHSSARSSSRISAPHSVRTVSRLAERARPRPALQRLGARRPIERLGFPLGRRRDLLGRLLDRGLDAAEDLLDRVAVLVQPLRLVRQLVLLGLDLLVVRKVREILRVRVRLVRLRFGRVVVELLVMEPVLTRSANDLHRVRSQAAQNERDPARDANDASRPQCAPRTSPSEL